MGFIEKLIVQCVKWGSFRNYLVSMYLVFCSRLKALIQEQELFLPISKLNNGYFRISRVGVSKKRQYSMRKCKVRIRGEENI